MLKVAFSRVKPEKEQRLRDWLAQLTARQDEIRQTFIQEGATQEQAYVLPTSDGPILVYVMDVADSEHAKAAYAASSLPIDVEHRAVMSEVLTERLKVAPLFDCALRVPDRA
jgi:hypothetical protein